VLENSTKDYKHGWVIKGGQKYFTTHNEKSARDKNFQIESSKTIWKVAKTIWVGHTNDRKENAPAGQETNSGRRSAWFLDQTREIPPNKSWFG